MTKRKPAPKKAAAKTKPQKADATLPDAAEGVEPRGVGRPSLFRDEFASQAKKLAALGATDLEMADFFGVNVATLHRWKAGRPEFCESLKAGKEESDERVTRSLFSRATGYEHDEVDIRVVNGAVVQTPVRKFYPPDTVACIFWLKNRRPDLWRDKQDLEHTGKDGGPIQTESRVQFYLPENGR